MTRALIVNADDFGQTAGINIGVIEAHERGIVTSASLMVRWPAADEAAAYARSHPAFAVGLHVDLGEWERRDGEWVRLYDVPGDPAGVLASQLERFRALLGRDPSHLDSHQHVHRWEPLRTAMTDLAGRLGVPARELTEDVRYCGSFYGQDSSGNPFPEGIGVERLLRLLTGLPHGTTELACHPGRGKDVDSMYRVERELELEALCDPRVHARIEAAEVRLCSFVDLA